VFVIPSTQTGFTSGIPITTAVTGGASSYWWGQPIRYVVQTDTFVPVIAAVPVSGGTSHAVGDIITLPQSSQGIPPVGAPAQLQVLTAPGGIIGTVVVVNVFNGASTPIGGSYFKQQPNPVAQASTTGSGTGATFTLTYGPPASQRVILTNQEFATLSYIQQITDPNIMDSLFQTAWISLTASKLSMALKENGRAKANELIKEVNSVIMDARVADGNEGLTINDVTPDFIRTRGIMYADTSTGPYDGFQWGDTFPMY
jgi:hypothetical protein